MDRKLAYGDPGKPRITERQSFVLDALRRHGHYNKLGCGWTYGTHTETVRVLEALVKKGYATREEKTDTRTREPYDEYRPVKAA
jgi:hypothetical protein